MRRSSAKKVSSMKKYTVPIAVLLLVLTLAFAGCMSGNGSDGSATNDTGSADINETTDTNTTDDTTGMDHEGVEGKDHDGDGSVSEAEREFESSYGDGATVPEGTVPVTSDLQSAVEESKEGSTLVLAPGTYDGGVNLSKDLELRGFGRNQVVVEAGPGNRDSGTGIKVAQYANVKISNLTVSGFRKGIDLSGTYRDTVIENVVVRSSVFGIDSRKSIADWSINRSILTGNGRGVYDRGSKGNWEIDSSVIANSTKEGITVIGSKGGWSIRNTVFRNNALRAGNIGSGSAPVLERVDFVNVSGMKVIAPSSSGSYVMVKDSWWGNPGGAGDKDKRGYVRTQNPCSKPCADPKVKLRSVR
ncbi:MAG: NosD domain-containing protein [Halobacteria archaeon]